MNWDWRAYLAQRRSFIANRSEFHPLGFASTLILGATWLSGWLFSLGLLQLGVHSIPLRYALAFVASYGVFFVCVRVWCGFVHWDRGQGGAMGDVPMFDAEGCLWIVLVFLLASIPAFLFWLSGGFAALLEVAFEVVFAGTVVRRLNRIDIVGNWARALLAGTWMHALAALLILVGAASLLQRAAPEAATFAQAVRAIRAK